MAFVDAIEQVFRYVERHPAIGSTRYAQELNLPGLRCWRVKRYPYLVFYVERDDHIDAWRVLHGQRDIPVWLRESDRDDIRRACRGFELGLCRCRKLLRA